MQWKITLWLVKEKRGCGLQVHFAEKFRIPEMFFLGKVWVAFVFISFYSIQLFFHEFQYKYLLPLADEVPEFVSYFVAYSVTRDSLRQSLFSVLNHWLSGRRGDLIMAFIKETPIVTKHFASVVLFTCCYEWDEHIMLFFSEFIHKFFRRFHSWLSMIAVLVVSIKIHYMVLQQ